MRKKNKPLWLPIADSQVRHVWADSNGKNEVTVGPTYYAENGTPIDGESGDDMVYVRTEVSRLSSMTENYRNCREVDAEEAELLVVECGQCGLHLGIDASWLRNHSVTVPCINCMTPMHVPEIE